MEDVTAAELQQLPAPYATALSLHLAGLDDGGIAAVIGVEESAVPSVLRIAAAKLDRLRTVGTLVVPGPNDLDQPLKEHHDA